MREIKFRAWDSANKQMIDHRNIGVMVKNINNEVNKPHLFYMQSTGLKDSQGQEIYESDILSFDGNMTADDTLGFDPNGFVYDETCIHVVKWGDNQCKAGFTLDWGDNEDELHWKYKRDTYYLFCEGNCKVIGNIYENPELLNED